MKKGLIILVLSFIICGSAVRSQSMGYDYRTALGVKLGWWGGGALSVKHFIRDQAALEGLLAFWRNGFNITGLYQYHGDFANVNGLKWYVGVGGHIGFYNNKYYYGDGVYFGPDGVLGIDYKFNGAPINLSLDVQPGFDIPGGDFYAWGGLGIRFAF